MNMGSIRMVIARANGIAILSLIGALVRPLRAPRNAGGRKRNRETAGIDSIRNLARQNAHGNAHANELAQNVRLDTDAATHPPTHAQAAKRKICRIRFVGSENVSSGRWSINPCPPRRTIVRLTETDMPISMRLFGTVSPNPASQGRQLVHKVAWRYRTTPRMSASPCHSLSPASVRSPSAASRSSGCSIRAAIASKDEPILVMQ